MKRVKRLSLGELTKHTKPICYGVLKPGFQDPNGIPLIRVTDISGNYFDDTDLYKISPTLDKEFKRSRVYGGEILISIQGTIGRVAVVPENIGQANISRTIAMIVPDERVEKEYLYWYLRYLGNNDLFETTGTTRDSLNIDALRRVEIPIPSQDEQKRIASLLARADRLRTLRRTAHELGESLLQSVFLEMFGDPKTNPMEWKKAKLGDVVTSIQDGPHVSPEYVDTGIPFLSTRNVRPGQLIWEDMKYISEENARTFWKRKGSKPEKGDILYTKGGTTGYAKVVDFEQQVAVWVHIAVLKLHKNLVNPFWLESMLNSEYCYKQSQELTFGIVNRDFGILRMPRVEIYLPPLSLQEKFAGVVARVESLRGRMSEAGRQVEGLFESLLAESFS